MIYQFKEYKPQHINIDKTMDTSINSVYLDTPSQFIIPIISGELIASHSKQCYYMANTLPEKCASIKTINSRK